MWTLVEAFHTTITYELWATATTKPWLVREIPSGALFSLRKTCLSRWDSRKFRICRPYIRLCHVITNVMFQALVIRFVMYLYV
jgi:hypothetical protein